MKLPRAPHSWKVTPRKAVALQRELAACVIRSGRPARVRLICGMDLAFSSDGRECVAGAVVWDLEQKCVVEERVVRRPTRFPYVPGLLSFREVPPIMAVLRRLITEPDVFLCDGQGYAHPRRIGLASHLGVVIDRPCVGCAKSLLIGQYANLGPARGAAAPLMHNDEQVGVALRTRDEVAPVYVSVGHMLSLETAIEVVLACGEGFRVPQPTRLADLLVSIERKRLGH